jgi:hypothetical protein
VNDAIIPSIVAAGGGGALFGGILIQERRADAAMRASRVRLSLVFPAGADPTHAMAALGSLAGGSDRLEYVFEVSASNEGIRHFLLVPAAAKASVVATLTGALPGLRVAPAPALSGRATVAAKLYLPTPVVLATANPEGATRTLIAGIAALRPGEQASLKWAARPGRPRPFEPKEPLSRATRDAERAWRGKAASGSGFQLAGLILVRAGSVARAREIADHLASSLRSRRGAVGSLRITTERGNRSMASLPRTTRSSGWVTAGGEALGLLAWPLGDLIPGVEVGGSRQLVVPRYAPSTGRRLLIGRDSIGNERPVALSTEAARLHLALLGSTGSGKTTVLIRLILDALAQGYGGVFVDPKDAIETLIDHVPPEHACRVVVLDASATGSIPGLDLFGSGDPVMRSDVILSLLKGVSEGWGSRVERFLRLGLRSLQALPDPVLFDWLRLYSEPGLRRAATARLADPVITAEWRAYESLSPAQQQEYAAPAIARITDLLSRPALRAVLSQPNPKLDIGRLLDERKWLCVSLSPGTLGEPAANLLGGVVTYLVWAAVEKRVAIPPHQRAQVMLVMDELQSLVNLPVGLEVAFERFRSLNCAVVAATQAVSRLPERTQQSLLANVGSLLTFRGGADESQRLARELSPLTAADIAGLARYEIGGRVNTGGLGSGSAVITGHTEPLPPATGMGADIRAQTAEHYGRNPREVEAELRQRGAVDIDGGGYGRTGRAA